MMKCYPLDLAKSIEQFIRDLADSNPDSLGYAVQVNKAQELLSELGVEK